MPSSALVSLSFVQEGKSNAKPTTTALPKKFIPDYIMTRYKGRAIKWPAPEASDLKRRSIANFRTKSLCQQKVWAAENSPG